MQTYYLSVGLSQYLANYSVGLRTCIVLSQNKINTRNRLSRISKFQNQRYIERHTKRFEREFRLQKFCVIYFASNYTGWGI